MTTQLLNYSLQASLCLLFFYLFYRLLLHNQPSLVFNRLYLLLAPLLALALPLVNWNFFTAPFTSLSPAIQDVLLPEEFITANVHAEAGKATFITFTGFPEYLFALYGLVSVVLTARLCKQLLIIRYLAIEADALPDSPPHVKLLALEESHTSFAFLSYVFLNCPPNLTQEERQQVLDHELAHVQLRHTLDVLYYELLVLLFWFNPAIWLLRTYLLDVHEYQADARALQKHHPQHYRSLLARYTLYANGVFIGSNFGRRQVFRRLLMIGQIGRKGSLLRQVMLLPLLCLMVLFFSARQAAADKAEALAVLPLGTNPDGSLKLQITWAPPAENGHVMFITWNDESNAVVEEEPAPVSLTPAIKPEKPRQERPQQKKIVAAPPAVAADQVEQIEQVEQEKLP